MPGCGPRRAARRRRCASPAVHRDVDVLAREDHAGIPCAWRGSGWQAHERPLSGPIDLDAIDTRADARLQGGKADARRRQAELAERLATLQEQLYAEGRSGGTRSVLLVLQGMDTAGKGGTVRHVVGSVDPQGVHVAASAPTRGGARARLPLADPRAAAASRQARRLRPLALRGRARRPRARARAARTWSAATTRSTASRSELADGGHDDRQVHAAHLARRAARAAAGAARRPDQALEVQPAATSRSARSGTTTWPPTPTRSSAATPRPRPGTSSPPIASGTATGRSRSCWCEELEGLGLRWPEADVRRRRRAAAAAEHSLESRTWIWMPSRSGCSGA